MIKILPLKQFRLLKEWSKRFKITDDSVIAYAGVIYSNKNLPPDLIIHEKTHLEQQKKYGLDEFTKRYLNDRKFRLEMEALAYKAQIDSITDKDLREAVVQDSMDALKSGLYGKLTDEEAKRILGIKNEKKLDVNSLI